MFVVDTNILVHAADSDSPYFRPCRDAIERWRKGSTSWFITWGICFEFLRLVTHREVLHQPQTLGTAWAWLDALLESPTLAVLTPSSRYRRVAAEVFSEYPMLSGNVMHDLETVILMREHGVSTICTRDRGFRRFKFLKAIDPVDEGPMI